MSRPSFGNIASVEGGRSHAMHSRGMTAHERHQHYIANFVKWYGNGVPPARSTGRTDYDVLRDSFRFVRDESDNDASTWEKRLAKSYYDKLFKEYCLADMTRYKHGQMGLRWRTEKEVVVGKGQFICGNKDCSETQGLQSFEVNFAYKEAGERKNALVKLRVCPMCAFRLHYKKVKKWEKSVSKAKKHRTEPSDEPKVDKRDLKHRWLSYSQGIAQEAELAAEPVAPTRTEPTPAASADAVDTALQSATASMKRERDTSEAAVDESQTKAAAAVWAGPAKAEPTMQDEFDSYFAGMFP
eukprot:TRINITY_DN12076_c0_g1_i1.p1 TRINITY_DN12076_c0_g1~~TRINITY_DN12076_c0_g1_i1.p1  ORF type:complete len:298 (-),score=55.91 TRINITY_DN12076_c0_g1_i1:99-992(-)